MENDVTNQLKEKIKSFLYFSLALDESTDTTDTAQLLIYIRGVDMELNIIEELLDIVSLKGRTCGEDIFDAVHDVGLKFALNWDKLVSITTDGAPSMTGREKGFVSRLRKFLSINNLPESKLVNIHCMIHREALCAQSASLNNVTSTVVKTVNYVKSSALRHRKFQEFLKTLGSEYTSLPYYSKIRWLSRGAVLRRFFPYSMK